MITHFEKHACTECQHAVTVGVDPDAATSAAPVRCAKCGATRFLVTEVIDENLLEKIKDALRAEPLTAGRLAREIGVDHQRVCNMLTHLQHAETVRRDGFGNWHLLQPLDVTPSVAE